MERKQKGKNKGVQKLKGRGGAGKGIKYEGTKVARERRA